MYSLAAHSTHLYFQKMQARKKELSFSFIKFQVFENWIILKIAIRVWENWLINSQNYSETFPKDSSSKKNFVLINASSNLETILISEVKESISEF